MKEHALLKIFGASAVLVASATTEPIVWHYLTSMSVAVILAVAGTAFDSYGSAEDNARSSVRRVGMAGVTAFVVFSVLRLQYADSIQVAAFSAAIAITGKDILSLVTESLLAKFLPPKKDERNDESITRGDTNS